MLLCFCGWFSQKKDTLLTYCEYSGIIIIYSKGSVRDENVQSFEVK